MDNEQFTKWQMLADHLRTRVPPGAFNQSFWFALSTSYRGTTTYPRLVEKAMHFSEMPCGTVACLWGHATDVWPDQLFFGISLRPIDRDCHGVFTSDGELTDERFRCNFFGISYSQESRIFGSHVASVQEKLDQMRRVATCCGYTLRISGSAEQEENDEHNTVCKVAETDPPSAEERTT